MANPFTLRVIPPGFPFCNRTVELEQLSSHAGNKANVVLFSPRRYGKTSLITPGVFPKVYILSCISANPF